MPLTPPEVLRLRFLGACEIGTLAGTVHLESAKTTALLAYLVLTPGTHARAALMEMLWPELTGERAAAALRRALWDQRRRIPVGGEAGVVLANRQTVGLNPRAPRDVDVERFLAACGGASRHDEPAADGELDELQRAVALYRGELLDGIAVEAAPAFDEWLVGERERYRLVALQVLRQMIAALRRRGENMRALGYARRLLALDPWLEEAHRAVAELLALGGQHGAALQQLEACRRVLAQELGVSPSPRTVELERRLREPRRLDGGEEAGAASTPPSPPLPRHNLPIPPTQFVGREAELEEIARLLGDPSCRLLTLLGPGGAGKTRLALQAAGQALGAATAGRQPSFERIAFVGCGVGYTGDVLMGAIASALELVPAADQDVCARVVQVLRDRRALLVVDGFEQSREHAGMLSELLGAAAETRVLVTSRERLGVPEEWVLEIGGLALPGKGAAGDESRAAAVQLFLRGARRVSVGFAVDGKGLTAVAGICRAVEGLPLAIELASAWMHALTPADVAAELATGLDLIAAPDAEPGRRLAAVFDHSYLKLSPSERHAVRAMSVLAGGMTRVSAFAVAGATIEMLRALADRSFLRFDPAAGRYSMHEVLRHYAGVKLQERAEERAAAWQRLQQHLAEMVAGVEAALVTRGERAALDAVAAEADNLRAAWAHAVASGQPAFVAAILPAVAVLCEARGWYREGERLAGEALDLAGRGGGAKADTRGMVARALVRRGGMRNRLGRYDEAAADLGEALALLARSRGGDRALALFHLGDAALLQGRFAEAHDLLQRSHEAAEASGNVRMLADGLARLGRAVLDEGRHAEARALFEESLAVARRAGNQQAVTYAATQLGFVDYFDGNLDAAGARFAETLRWAQEAADPAATAAALNGLAYVAEDRGELDHASDLYRRSLALAQEQGDRFTAGRVLMLSGETARKQGRLAEARRSYEESLAINEALSSRFIVGILHGNLAFVACGEGRLDEARLHVSAALREYAAGGSFTIALPAVVGLAEIARAEGDDDRALALLGLVLGHPGNRQDHRVECERVLAPIRQRRPAAAIEAGLAAGGALALDALTSEILSDRPAHSPDRRPRGRSRSRGAGVTSRH